MCVAAMMSPMPALRTRPCSICRGWFRPDPRVGAREGSCSKPECEAARRKKTQGRWRAKNPDYAAGYCLQRRHVQEQPPEPLRVPPPLNRLPWDLAKDEFGGQAADFLAVMGALVVRSAKDQMCRYVADPTRVPRGHPAAGEKDV